MIVQPIVNSTDGLYLLNEKKKNQILFEKCCDVNKQN